MVYRMQYTFCGSSTRVETELLSFLNKDLHKSLNCTEFSFSLV